MLRWGLLGCAALVHAQDEDTMIISRDMQKAARMKRTTEAARLDAAMTDVQSAFNNHCCKAPEGALSDNAMARIRYAFQMEMNALGDQCMDPSTNVQMEARGWQYDKVQFGEGDEFMQFDDVELNNMSAEEFSQDVAGRTDGGDQQVAFQGGADMGSNQNDYIIIKVDKVYSHSMKLDSEEGAKMALEHYFNAISNDGTEGNVNQNDVDDLLSIGCWCNSLYSDDMDFEADYDNAYKQLVGPPSKTADDYQGDSAKLDAYMEQLKIENVCKQWRVARHCLRMAEFAKCGLSEYENEYAVSLHKVDSNDANTSSQSMLDDKADHLCLNTAGNEDCMRETCEVDTFFAHALSRAVDDAKSAGTWNSILDLQSNTDGLGEKTESCAAYKALNTHAVGMQTRTMGATEQIDTSNLSAEDKGMLAALEAGVGHQSCKHYHKIIEMMQRNDKVALTDWSFVSQISNRR